MTEIAGQGVGLEHGDWLCLVCEVESEVETNGGHYPSKCPACGDTEHWMVDASESKEVTLVLSEDEVRLLLTWSMEYWNSVRSWDSGKGPVPAIAARVNAQSIRPVFWGVGFARRMWEKRTW